MRPDFHGVRRQGVAYTAHMSSLNDLQVAARDRVHLLERDVPAELQGAWDVLIAQATELGVDHAAAEAWLASWLTEYLPAIDAIPSILIRRQGEAGVELVRTMLLRCATGAYS